MVKIYRIGYVEDDEIHFTVPIDNEETLSEIYKSFDTFAIATDNNIWVEVIEGEWNELK